MDRPVSMQTIAIQAGVSKMTVSLALRDHPRIPRATREQVKKVAASLGYKPNPKVSQLMSAIRSHAREEQGLPLAYITTGLVKGQWKESPTESAYYKGACQRAKEYGYFLEEHWMDEPLMSEHRLSDILWHRGINGLIIPPMIRTLTEEIRSIKLEFDWERFAVVAIGDMLTSPQFNRVIHDHYTSVLTAMDRLLELGYRRIGLCLIEHMDLTVNQRWQAGYRVYRANHPIDRIEPLILPDLSPRVIKEWMQDNHLDAILSAERRMPQFIKDMGLTIGKDIGYADLDLDTSDPLCSNLSGIVQNSDLLGMAAVDVVVSALNRDQSGVPEVPFVTQVEGTWISRASTPSLQ